MDPVTQQPAGSPMVQKQEHPVVPAQDGQVAAAGNLGNRAVAVGAPAGQSPDVLTLVQQLLENFTKEGLQIQVRIDQVGAQLIEFTEDKQVDLATRKYDLLERALSKADEIIGRAKELESSRDDDTNEQVVSFKALAKQN